MPCRDYEYEEWLHQAFDHLRTLKQLLYLLCQAADEKGVELPPPVAQWWQERKQGEPKERPLTQEYLDNLAQLLCLLCQAMEQKGLEMPPDVTRWWQQHKAKDEERHRSETQEPK